MAVPDFLLDKRIVERNIAKGLVKRQDLTKAISKLPDVESNSEPCVLDAPEEEGEGAEGTGEEAEAPAES